MPNPAPNGVLQSPGLRPGGYVPPAVGRSHRTTPPATPPSPNTAPQVFNIIIPPGPATNPGTYIVPASGTRVYILTATGPVHLKQINGVFLPLVAGQSFKLKDGSQFNSLIVKNPSATATLTCTLIVCFDDIDNFTAPVQPATVTEGVTLITLTGTVQALSTKDVYFTQGFFYGFKALVLDAPTNNGGNVSIGKSAAFLPDIIAPGQLDFPLQPPAGKMFNLASIYMRGTAGDGLFWSVLL